MKHKTLEKILVFSTVVNTILLFLLTVKALFPDFKLQNDCINNIISVIFSGIGAAVISVILVIWQMEKNRKALQFENQLKLREMFATPERMKIHKIIKKGIEEPWNYKTNDSSLFYDEFEFKTYRDDYLGIFEIMNYMIDKEELDADLCFQSYSYRISKIASYKPIKDMLDNPNYQLWKPLKEIIKKNNIWKSKHNITD